MKRYEVVLISTYGEDEDEPDVRASNMKYPEIVPYVEDEEDVFVVNDKKQFWKASEFFHMVNIDEFFVEL